MKMRLEHGFTTIISQCPKITRSTQGSSHGKLFINTTSGHFVCEHCNKQGAWTDLVDNLLLLKTQRRKSTFTCFKDLDTVKPFLEENNQAKEVWSSCLPFGALQEEVVTKVKEAFDLETIKTSTLDAFDVRCDPKNLHIVFPVIAFKNVTSVKRLICQATSDDTTGTIKESYVPRTGPSFVFGLDTVRQGVTEVVLTTSELDAMAVTQETNKPAIALPRGYSSLPQEVLPSLERFRTIVLWFGDDVRAWEMAKLFSKKLNSRRCHIIRPSLDEPGPFTALTQGLKLSSVLNKSRPVTHESIVSFSQLRQEVLSQLLHSDQVAGVKWKRYPALNKYLKGHRRGELTVFTGPTGSGKTTFISDYSLDLCMQGVNTLWGSFEINNVRLGKMMLTQFAMRNLSKRLDLFDQYADQFQLLPMYFMTFHGQESIKKVIDAMSHAVYVHDIAHVVVDNLQFMMGAGGSEWTDRFMRQDSIVAAFRKFATNMNCHVTLVIHPRKEKESEDLTTASVFGSAKATQEADNVLILQDKRLTSVRGRKYLQITKNRFDGELGLMLLKFDKESLSFASKEKEKAPAKKAAREEDEEADKDVGSGETVRAEREPGAEVEEEEEDEL
ncbi:twinkle protein, mitochondrial [Aplysia californica]|uniref:Twinkle protein, mitochondrial n=1 Tax=Aplysia californica TaxID=6500 RepID=A0ABM1A9X5_APLCA|nr:twinkle protein, mitochondrial [Aplysia californica]